MNEKNAWFLVTIPVVAFVLGGGILINLQNKANVRMNAMMLQRLDVIENSVATALTQGQPTRTTEVQATETNTKNQVTTKELIVTSPKNGGTYSQENQLRVSGKTKPGYYIQVYANYSTQDLKCLNINSFSSGGADRADANGKFDFTIPGAGFKRGQNTLTVVAIANPETEMCYPNNNTSEPITFTYTGAKAMPN